MTVNKNQLFVELLNNFLEIDKQIEAIIVSDEQGLVIAGEKRKDVDMELVSFLTAVVNPIIERIRNEFAFKRFGTASFDTDKNRLLFISIDEITTLSVVLEGIASIDKLAPYTYFLAEKIAQILNVNEGDLIQLKIPDFEYEVEAYKSSNRLKNQIYQSKLDHGGTYRFKFIIIGDHEVGKTSIIRRFVENKFLADYRTTIGLNIVSHDFEAFENDVSLFLWDIGAQEYFKRYRKTYYGGAQAAFIVFNLTARETFDNVINWYNELMEFIENKELPIIIVGNKTDLIEQRIITYEEGAKLASELSELSDYSIKSGLSEFSDLSDLSEKTKTKVPYIETSALTGDHVIDAFNLICYHFIIRSKEIEEERLDSEIKSEINSILDNIGSLTLSFITKDSLWNPGLQILTEIRQLGNYLKYKDDKKEKIYQYTNGLIIKNYLYNSFKISDSDGVLCLFDAREKDHIDPKWKEIVIKILDEIEINRVVFIGIRVSEKTDWSLLKEEFDVYNQVKEKSLSYSFFKIEDNYRMDIHEELVVMLNFIKQRLFTIKLEDKAISAVKAENNEVRTKKEEEIKSQHLRSSKLKEEFESASNAAEIKAEESVTNNLIKEPQIKLNETDNQIEYLKNEIVTYEKKGKKGKKLKEALKNLGRAYTIKSEYDNAVEALKKALEIDSKFAVAWNILGANYFGKGDYSQAIDAFLHLVKLEPNNHSAWYNLGRVYTIKSEYDNAIKALKKALKIDSNFAIAWNVMGAAYYGKSVYNKAINSFQHFLKLEPNDPAAWYNLAECFFSTENYEDALDACSRSLEIDINFEAALKLQERISAYL